MTTFDDHVADAIRVTRPDPIAHLDWPVVCQTKGCNAAPTVAIIATHAHPSRSVCMTILACERCAHGAGGWLDVISRMDPPECRAHGVPVDVEPRPIDGGAA